MLVGRWCFAGVTMSNGYARCLPHAPGVAFIILGQGEQRIGRLAVGNGMGQPTAASCLLETLLAVDGEGLGRGGDHG